MSEDLEQFRNKIESYNQDQLEEILVTLNKLKFPDKFEVVKEVLAQQTGRTLKEDQSEKDAQLDQEIDKESESVVKTDELVKEEPEVSPLQNAPYSRKRTVSSVKHKAGPIDNQAGLLQSMSPLLVILVVLTSLISVYVMLQTFTSLPGKSFITKLANKISTVKTTEYKSKKIPAPVHSVLAENKS